MKQGILNRYLFALLAMSIVFTSCSEDENNDAKERIGLVAEGGIMGELGLGTNGRI